jgi:methyltransferase (TIGR00027 family)
MIRRRASRTAPLVTMVRAVANAGITEVREFSDPTALPLLPLGWRLVTRLAVRGLTRNPQARARVFEGSKGSFDVIALRTRVFDEAWHAARAAGTRQLVLLGAGLDGRAFRLGDLDDVVVFEVDHPATQAVKRARARGLVAKATKHVYVGVDFERDRLDEALAAAGQDATRPTFWIWEGVTPYLTADAQRATLAAVARRSAPGSGLAVEYIEPGGPGDDERLPRLFGEPWIGLQTRAEAAARLAEADFTTIEDTGVPEWRARFSAGPPRDDKRRHRIAVARLALSREEER